MYLKMGFVIIFTQYPSQRYKPVINQLVVEEVKSILFVIFVFVAKILIIISL